MKTLFTLCCVWVLTTSAHLAGDADLVCSVQLEYEIETDFYNKKIGNNPVSKKKGSLSLCINQMGKCNWKQEGSFPEIEHMDLILQSLELTVQEEDIDRLLQQSQKQAKVTPFNDGSIGIRKKAKGNQDQVLIIDPNRKLIVGTNFYDASNNLVKRLVFKYAKNKLTTASYLLLDHNGVAMKEYVLQFKLLNS